METDSLSRLVARTATPLTTQRRSLNRRTWLVGGATFAASLCVTSCGGGGGGSNDDGSSGGGDGGGGGSSGPIGLIAAKSIDNLEILNASTGESSVIASTSTGLRVGVSGSNSSVICDAFDEDSSGSWKVQLIEAKTRAVRRTIALEREFASLTSAVSINADATRIAFSVNEPDSSSNNTRVDRSFVGDLTTLELTRIEGVSNPVFVGSELMVRLGERLRMLNANLDDMGDLGVTVTDRSGGPASASTDGRYIAYDRDNQIWVLDRQTQRTWQATTELRGTRGAVFSPDGRHLAMLRGGSTAGVYVHVVPFVPEATYEVTDANQLRNAAGSFISGSGSLAWVPA